jgi:Leucine-rich repeat (LRR) protein
MTTFKNFEEIRLHYPEMQGMMLSHNTKSMQIHICESEDKFLDDIWSIGFDPEWTKLDVSDTDEWYYDLAPYADLPCLILRYTNYMDLEKCDWDFTKLKKVQCLRVNFDSTSEKNKPTLTIPSMPCLQILTCFGWHEVKLAEKIENLHRIAFYSTQQLNLPALLEKLNPQVLTHFHVQFTNNLQFFPDLKKPKKGEILPTFTRFEAFVNLEHLGVPSHRLKELPFSLVPFTRLTHLDISTNPLTTFPDDFLDLPRLENVDISSTSIVKNRLIRGGSELMKLIASFNTHQVSSKDRKILFAILLENKAVEENIALPDILRLLPVVENSNLLRKVLALGERKTPNPMVVGKVTNIALIGKLPATNTQEIKAFFKNYNIQIQTKITAQTQIVCIGEQLRIADWEALLADISKYTVCFPSHLKEFMTQLETPQFATLEPESVQNLETLLQSEDETNVLLALQMLKHGGLPDLIFEFLCLKLVRNDWNCRKELLQILEKYASPAQFAILKKFAGQFYDFEKYLTWLFESPDFNQLKLTQVAFKFFTHEKSEYYRRNFLRNLKALVWRTTGEALECVLDRYVQENGTLILENESMALKEIPTVLTGNLRIKNVIVLETLFKKAPKKAYTILQSLPNLTSIEILYVAPSHLSKEAQEILPTQLEAKYQQIFAKQKVIVTRYAGKIYG